MLSPISDNCSGLKKQYHDDLPDYDRGTLDGRASAHLAWFIVSTAPVLFGVYKGKRWSTALASVLSRSDDDDANALPSRLQYPLVQKSIRMNRDSEVLLPSWRRPFPRRWVKVNQSGLVHVARSVPGGSNGRMGEAPEVGNRWGNLRCWTDERGGRSLRDIVPWRSLAGSIGIGSRKQGALL